MGTETAIVPVTPEPLWLRLLRDEDSSPLERLDANMRQTPDWVQLRGILEQGSPWVRDTICGLLLDEMSRSFQNVVGQLRTFREVMAEMQATMDSEDAQALHHLLRDMQPSGIAALQREANGISEHISSVRSHLERGDFSGVHSLAQRIANKAKRFRGKYEELRPQLDRLQRKVQEIADKCTEAAQRSDELIEETKQRRDKWFALLCCINCVLAAGGLLVFAGAGGTVLVAKGMLLWKASALAEATSTLVTAKAAAAAKFAAAADAAALSKAAAAAATPTAAATGSSVGTAIGVASIAGLRAGVVAVSAGAPAATLFGSQTLGGLAVKAGLMAAPAAPLGVVVGAASAAAAAAGCVYMLWSAASAALVAPAAGDAAFNAFAAAMAAFAAKQAAAEEAAAAAAQVASATQNVNALQLTLQTLPTVVGNASPFVIGSACILALALLGYCGRSYLKSLLGRLWAAEIQEHERSKAAFRRVAQMLQETTQKLTTICQKSEALEDCLDVVVEVAEELAGTAQDAQDVVDPQELHAETLKMHEQVNKLCATYASLPTAFEQLHASVRELEAQVIQSDVVQPTELGPGPPLVIREGDVHIPEVNRLELPDPDGEWILVESPPPASPSTNVELHDCLPLNTYLLVAVECAARLGALLAAGPGGNRVCQVLSQGQALRPMSHFSAVGEHRLTAGHPLRVQRSGSWIHERASLLQSGDVVLTFSGSQVVESVAGQVSNEEVFSLDIQGNQEVFMFTITPGNDGRISLGSVAVLSSMAQEDETARRSTSAPPRLRNGFPSIGSKLCKGTSRCTNICRKFLRGTCLDGQECKFCHLPHPEEPKRAVRGQRFEARSSYSA
ncbi:unnamed protein product [Symbiodinium natans]|uniref:C3H1-type domain-containing protein n=1 Tax=Symbiodinium natans TaxID=878477 RepID=A0A812Q133_9DINO|nr:unnamed protein product [Symbiodinium natans]